MFRKFFTLIGTVGILAGFVFLIGLMGAMRPDVETKAPDIAPPTVFFDVARAQAVTLDVAAQGEVRPRTDINLTSQVGGQIVDTSEKFVDGGAFKKGDLLVKIEGAQYRAAAASAAARVAQAEEALKREEAEAALAARDYAELGRDGDPTDLTLRKPQLAQARANYEAAKADLRSARLDLQRTEIRAPFDGRVRQRIAGLGQFVSPGAQIGRIFSTDVAEIRLPLTDSDLAKLGLPLAFNETDDNPGPPAMLTADIAGEFRQWRGRVARTDGAIDPGTRQIAAIVVVDDPYGEGAAEDGTPLPMGLFVNAVIEGKPYENAIVLPRAALYGRDAVFVIRGDDTVETRKVRIVSDDRDSIVHRQRHYAGRAYRNFAAARRRRRRQGQTDRPGGAARRRTHRRRAGRRRSRPARSGMMSGLISWWARNTIAANLLMVAIFVAGAIAFLRLEREVFPSATFAGATVSVTWPGASPQEVEEQLILRVEEALTGIDGIKHISATAREGVARINVEGDNAVDQTFFLNEIKNRVDGISTFPAGAFPPVVSQWRNNMPAQFIGLFGDLEPRELNRLARELRDELSQLPGGSPLVDMWGELNEEVSIEVSEESLRRFGLTFDDVANAIRGSSINVAGGQVRTDTGNVQIAARNLADTEQEFADIVVLQQADGAVVRVSDVATVIDGVEDRRQKREMNGKPVINLAVQSPETLNIVEISEVVNKWVDEKNKELDGEAELFIWFDFADIYFGRMELVSTNAVIGLILVLIVLVLFLRPAVAFWVTVGIAISFAGAFIFMPMVGVSLNMLSLFAFLLVIGVVVDDAIIVGENIHNEVENGGEGVTAAIAGAQFVAKPVLFAVLTTMIAFIPFLFVSGGVSQFAKHITWTVIFALAFSLIESFLILPAHLSHLKPQNKEGVYYRLQGFFAEGLMTVADKVYRPIVRLALQLRYFTVAIFVGFFMVATALLAQGWIPFTFEPAVQGTFVSLQVRLPEGAPWKRSEQIFDEIEEAGARLTDKLNTPDREYVKSVYIGAEEGSVTSYLTIVDGDERDESTKEVAEMFREELGPIPDAEEITIGYTINDEGPELNFGVESDNLESLRVAVLDVQNFIRSLPGTYDVRNNLQSATPELQIFMKPGAERFGLTLAEVSQQVRQAYYGEEVQRLPRGGQDVRVMVRYPREARESITSIENMRIRTRDGREVPLTAVADARFAPSFKRIERYDRKRSARISGELREGADKEGIMKIYREEFVPEFERRHPDVSLARRGGAEGQAEFLSELTMFYAAALFAMYMLIAIAFGSYWQPVLIMSAIPFGFMGAVFGHMIFGIEFAFFSFFGIGAAAGVVINDNLVLIDRVNHLREQGEGALSALVKAGVARFRPIVLTSVTTFIGLLPIMFERSTDAQFLQPTVVSLAFGVMFALFVTLLFVPAMYAVGADIARFYRWAWTGEKQAKLGYGKSADSDFAASHPHGVVDDLDADGIKRGKPPVLRPAE